MADPQPDQGFFPGLLGKVGNWFGSYDPQAAYGGLLSDPDVKQQFRIRELGAVAASMAANSMPVPYKGGTPWGSFLGAAGGAAATAGDSLMKARLEAAQAGLANQTVEATKSMMPMYQALFDEAKRNAGAGGGGAAGTGGATGAPGAPAKGIDITPLARLGTGDTKSTDAILSGPLGDKIRAAAAKYNLDPVMFAAQINAESSGNPNAGKDKEGGPMGLGQLMPKTAEAMGVKNPWDPEQNLDGSAKYLRQGLDKFNGDLPNALKYYYSGSTDEKAWGPLTNAYPSRVFALAPKPDQTAAAPGAPVPAPAASATPPAAAPRSQDGALAPGDEGYTPGPQGLLAPRPAGAGPIPPSIPRNSRGEPYAPMGPGDAVAAGTPGASPVITPQQATAANAGGGNRLPVMPSDYIFGKGQVAPPGAGQVTPETAGPPPAPPAGAPGPVGGLLNPEPSAVAGLSPAAAAIAQGMTAARGGALPPSGAVAGPGAPSEPPPPAAPPAPRSLLDPNAGMEGGPPLPAGTVNPQAGPPGLMSPQGPAAPGPQPAPPVTPGPQAAPRSPFPPVGPPPQLPPLPSQMPAIPAPQMPQATPGQAAAMGIAGISALIGKPAPEWIQKMAAMPGEQAMETFKSWLQVQQQGMTARDKAALDLVVQPYLKQVEAATAAQYKTEVYRPGAGVGIGGQPPTSYAPEHITAFNPATQRMEHATQTNQPNGPPIIQFSGVPAGPSPAEQSGGAERGRIGAQQEPLAGPQQPAQPSGTPPKPAYQGYRLAPNMTSKEPDYQEPQLNETQLKAGYAAENWPKTTRELTSSIGAAQAAEQRLTSMATAFQQVNTGAFTSDKAAWNNTLDGVFGPGGGPGWLRTSNDAGAVMTAMHEAMRATLSNLKATNPRFANAEFQGLSKMSENPDLPASANLNMLAEDIGQLRQQQGLANGWIEARANGKQDPDLFEAKWLAQNKLPPIVDAVKKEIGVGKLVPGGQLPDLPEGTTPTGRTYQGKPIYNVPDGKGGFKQQVLH